ncbi:putative aspartic peptidase A1 family, aspartic peptidase domain superfamily, xylanase inhibitor [Helianthus annuus]|nr:putative aspartic peptidase A1 family, aspartic peptidase domain superfamily, xylanase inhibitor [Helianthus annuus]
MHLLKLLFFILASFSHTVCSRCLSHTVDSGYNTSVIPIIKDENTSLHKVPFGLEVLDPNQGSYDYLIIDLDTPYAWKDIPITNSPVPCDVEDGCWHPVRCDTDLCKEAKSYINPICPTPNKTDCSMCIVTPLNPVSNACVASNLTTDLLRPYWTDGRNPINCYPRWPFGARFQLSTAPTSLDQSFPKDVRGVAGFSWSGLCIPRQLNSTGVTTAAKFALCLPSSSSARGVTFVGEGPFYFKTNPNVDLRSYLSYTPMIRKSSISLGYYIKINRISIKGTPVNSVPKGGSVKMSTIVTYTTLRSDIYKALVESFSNATAGIPQVPAVEPFGLCFEDGAYGSGSVPNIDLEMENENIWSVSVENSIKRVGNGAACLAFVDGGSKVTDPIVIGTFQMENNFLYFDLENQQLGFSSSLLSRGTNCSNFNFNVVESYTYQLSSE